MFHATSQLKLQGGQHTHSFSLPFRNKIRNRRPNWQTRISSVNMIMSSGTGTVTNKLQFETDLNVLAIGTVLTISPSFSNNSPPYMSSTQDSTNRAGACSVCFEKDTEPWNARSLQTSKKRSYLTSMVQASVALRWEILLYTVTPFKLFRLWRP